ncbi:hypothetical protein K2173_005800 [Erythroxylum novogranatense]|uniref:Adaptor protein ClpS core domain-containing protein n=1 Tax=Erythroxylum novogranatense TaxID=1862640 RepID=A0AAV8U5U2_9ROSI|nr:hypothetical protein K2173_005800 [Erythroxylum novogranatense]
MSIISGSSSASVLIMTKELRLVRKLPEIHGMGIRSQSQISLMGLTAKCGLRSSKGGGAGILERPNFDQSQMDTSLQVLEGGDIGRQSRKTGIGSGDSYRVLLVDDIRHTENLVAKVVPHVVPSVTPDEARRLFHESCQNGVAVVIVAVKEHAEFYAQMMIRNGLQSRIEPDSSNM